MTVKTPKTGTIRKITRAEINAISSGGFADESFPRDEVMGALQAVRSDSAREAFLEYLGPRLARHRAAAEPDMKPSDAQALIEETIDTITELRRRLECWPEVVRPHLEMACWQSRREHFTTFAQTIDADLKALWSMAVLAEREIVPGKKAAKATASRDWLAHDLVQWLMTHGNINAKSYACEIAWRVMQAIDGLKVPTDPRELEKDVNRFARASRENPR